MPLSKARMRERKRRDRLNVKPTSNPNTCDGVKPKQVAQIALVTPYSKEAQLKRITKAQKAVKFEGLKEQFDYRA